MLWSIYIPVEMPASDFSIRKDDDVGEVKFPKITYHKYINMIDNNINFT